MGMWRLAGSNVCWSAGRKCRTAAGAQSWRQEFQILEDATEVTTIECCACEQNGEQIGIGW